MSLVSRLHAGGRSNNGATVVKVSLSDVADSGRGGGLELRPPANLHPDGGNGTLSPDCAVQNAKVPKTCAWAAVELGRRGVWANASVSVEGSTMVLTVSAAAAAAAAAAAGGVGQVLGTAYGWGAIPMLVVYDKRTSLPVLPWNSSWSWNSSVDY